MSPDVSRRTLLGAGGLALLTGIAGCSFGTNPSSGPGSGGGAGPGTAGPGGGGGGGGNDDGPETTNTGRTYSFEVNNKISSDLLETVDDVDSDAPAKIHVEAAIPVQGGDDDVLFEQTVEVPPGEETTIDDAFTTELDNTYTVDVELEPFIDDPDRRMRRYRAGTRWQPNSFNAPNTDVLYVLVTNDDNREGFRPNISVG